MKGLIVRIQYIYRSLRQIGQPHLGARVTYKGEDCRLTQGVKHPLWTLRSDTSCYENVHLSQFVMDKSLRAKWTAFRFHYDFRMGYWHSIDTAKLRIFGMGT